jgi:hypothetical protein
MMLMDNQGAGEGSLLSLLSSLASSLVATALDVEVNKEDNDCWRKLV